MYQVYSCSISEDLVVIQVKSLAALGNAHYYIVLMLLLHIYWEWSLQYKGQTSTTIIKCV